MQCASQAIETGHHTHNGLNMHFSSTVQVPVKGQIRSCPEDFRVDEIPLVQPSGTGEHVWLHIRKTGNNTDWVARQLAQIAGVPRRDVGYAGLKDRHAITTQWFSVWLPGQSAPHWQQALPDGIELLNEIRHDRKLRRGVLRGNAFRITVRHCQGDRDWLEQRLEQLEQYGVPNYFGAQRFGLQLNNLVQAEAWFQKHKTPKNRQQRSLYLSAVRAWIFNHVLDQRVQNRTWNRALPGDVFILDGSNAWFTETVDAHIHQRVSKQDIHASGALWGSGALATSAAVESLEYRIAQKFELLTNGLVQQGLKQERRPLRVRVQQPALQWLDTQTIELCFTLNKGSYATAVLSELVNTESFLPT